jgi:hypothetical protein
VPLGTKAKLRDHSRKKSTGMDISAVCFPAGQQGETAAAEFPEWCISGFSDDRHRASVVRLKPAAHKVNDHGMAALSS